MEIEKQVVSLELSKKLKELGAKQESLFYWWHKWEGSSSNDAGKDIVTLTQHSNTIPVASAFTVAELGEMLKTVVKNRDFFAIDFPYWYDKRGKPTWQWEGGSKKDSYSDCAETEADARAQMLIFLIEEKLITP